MNETLANAVTFLKGRLPAPPAVGVILGSGSGSFTPL